MLGEWVLATAFGKKKTHRYQKHNYTLTKAVIPVPLILFYRTVSFAALSTLRRNTTSHTTHTAPTDGAFEQGVSVECVFDWSVSWCHGVLNNLSLPQPTILKPARPGNVHAQSTHLQRGNENASRINGHIFRHQRLLCHLLLIVCANGRPKVLKVIPTTKN